MKLEKGTAPQFARPSRVQLNSSSPRHLTPQSARAAPTGTHTHSDAAQQSSTHFSDTHSHSHWDHVRWCGPEFVSSFLSPLSSCSSPLPFFQPAMTGRPCHLFSILRNANAPSGCSAFARCQKLKSDKKKQKTNPGQQKKKHQSTP